MAKRKQQSTFERLNSGKLNRKQRKELIRQIEAEDPALEVIHRHAAGIDAGNESHMVSAPPDRDAQPIREFGSWTKGLQDLTDWLMACGIESVVMQSTGVYWVALYDILEERGFQVCLTSATPRIFLDGRATCRKHNGYESSIAMGCCGSRSVRRPRGSPKTGHRGHFKTGQR